MLGAIGGVEMVITWLSVKWKGSQNQPAGNGASVVSGLRERGGEQALATAALVKATLGPP